MRDDRIPLRTVPELGSARRDLTLPPPPPPGSGVCIITVYVRLHNIQGDGPGFFRTNPENVAVPRPVESKTAVLRLANAGLETLKSANYSSNLIR